MLQTLLFALLASLLTAITSYLQNPANNFQAFVSGLAVVILGAVWTFFTSHERDIINTIIPDPTTAATVQKVVEGVVGTLVKSQAPTTLVVATVPNVEAVTPYIIKPV